MNLRALLLGAFIGAATMYVLFTLRAPKGLERMGYRRYTPTDALADAAENEAAERIWERIVGDRDVRTDELSDLNGSDGATWEAIRGHIHE